MLMKIFLIFFIFKVDKRVLSNLLLRDISCFLAIHEASPEVQVASSSWILNTKLKRIVHLSQIVRQIFFVQTTFTKRFWITTDLFMRVMNITTTVIEIALMRCLSSLVLQEKLLSVGANLRASPGHNQLLDFLPVFAVNAKS